MKYTRLVVAIVIAVGTSIILTAFIGVELAFAVAWGGLAGILVLGTQLVMPEDPRASAPLVEVRPERRGTDIARMAWSINPRTGMAGALLTGRVRRVLAHRLSRIGIDVEDPEQRAQIDAIVGSDVWDRLIGRGTTRTDIERALEVVARLSPTKEKK